MTWNPSKNKQYWNNFHIFALLFLLILYSIRYKYCFILLGVYIFFLWKKRLFFKEAILLGFIFTLFGLVRLQNKTKLSEGNYYGIVEVMKIKKREENYQVIFGLNGENLLAYINDFPFLPGDILEVQGELIQPSQKSFSSDFDYAEYLSNQNIYYILQSPTFSYQRSRFRIERVKWRWYLRLEEKLPKETFSYVSSLLLGQTDETEVTEALERLDLGYLLSLCGGYIYFIYIFLKRLLFFISHSYEKSETVSLICLWGYLIFLGMPISFFRAMTFLTLGVVNERRSWRLPKLDIWSISILFFLLLNPKYAFQAGFILTFLICFGFTAFPIERKGIRNKYLGGIFISFLILPILFYRGGIYNGLSLLFGPILYIAFQWFVFPLSLCCAFLPTQKMNLLFSTFTKKISTLSQKQINLIFPAFSFLTFILYYILFFLLLLSIEKKKKRCVCSLIFLVFLFLFSNSLYLSGYEEVSFLDVGQADSCYIHLKDNKTILIDTYDGNIDYLKAKGIKRIDTLIITHSDLDHIKNLIDLCQQYPVNCLVGSIYDEELKAHEALRYVKKSLFVQAGNQIIVGNTTFDVLSPSEEAEDKNDNSLVLTTKIGNDRYLFTGDISCKIEQELLSSYKVTKIDVLKVAHHGSNTSSSEEFLSILQPKYAILSVGKRNAYGLPSEEVISRLKEYGKVYLTKENGNISFYYNHGKRKVSVYKK